MFEHEIELDGRAKEEDNKETKISLLDFRISLCKLKN